MAITDLTGYTWVGNSIITWNSMMSSYYLISFTSNNENFNYLAHSESPVEDFLEYITVPPLPSAIDVYDFDTNQWTNDAYKTITITGGTDATNSKLIAWLEVNGTLTAPQSSGKTQIGTRAITKKMFGTREITKEVVNGVTIYSKN